MGTSGRPSINKRQKEQARAEKQREKAAKRQQRKLDRQNGTGPARDSDTSGEAEGTAPPAEAPLSQTG